MTTKLKHLSNLTRTPHISFAANQLRINQCYSEPEVGFYNLEFSMDKMLGLQNIESLRRTMLMHEEIFKHQVQELHRLYSIQKKLMNELQNGITRRKEIIPEANNTNSECAVWHHKTTETGHNFQAFSARDDPIEVSASCSGENSRMTIKFDLERPSETTTSSNHLVEEQKDLERTDEETDVEVELTLSIGHSTRKKRSKSNLHISSTQLHNSGQSNKVGELDFSSTKLYGGEDEYGEPSSTISSSSIPLCQDNSRPHWLLQDLSLNKT